jgi:hypothetical protein
MLGEHTVQTSYNRSNRYPPQTLLRPTHSQVYLQGLQTTWRSEEIGARVRGIGKGFGRSACAKQSKRVSLSLFSLEGLRLVKT